MAFQRSPFVIEAVLRLDAGTDPGAPGAAVTVELCGQADHEGGCRWPHNNELGPVGAGPNFRTLFIAPTVEEHEVRDRIERALRAGSGWSVADCKSRALLPEEQSLAARLANTPLP
jgi:hypothetical protein